MRDESRSMIVRLEGGIDMRILLYIVGVGKIWVQTLRQVSKISGMGGGIPKLFG